MVQASMDSMGDLQIKEDTNMKKTYSNMFFFLWGGRLGTHINVFICFPALQTFFIEKLGP